ncbi:MAG TPA: hypothetical protein VEY88_05190, partial [Archangium sp.]|nr:hypothetical protein [Archangium sp.]
MSFSVNSKSRSHSSSQADKAHRADAKDSSSKQPEVKKNEPRLAEGDRFETQSQREPRRNLLHVPQQPDTSWKNTTRTLSAQQHTQAAPAMSPNEAFITQFKNDQFNPTGPDGSTNCGPTSLAISMAYTGHMPPGLSKEQQVDYARSLMHPEVTTKEQGLTWVKDANGNDVPQLNRDHELTGGTMEEDGIRAAGGTPAFGKGWEELDKALANGPVLSNGFYGPAWRDQFGPRANTGNTNTHPEGIGHVNCILGKTPEGKYLVADPMHRKGVVEMTREQLSVFYPKSGGTPTFAATNLGGSAPA